MINKNILPFILCAAAVFSISFSSCMSNNSSEDGSLLLEVDDRTEVERSQLDTIAITLNSNDKMQFDRDEIVVWAGQTVVLNLHHSGKMPKSAMGHNFVLIDNTISISDYADLAIKAKDTEYVPVSDGRTLAYTEMIGGGESTSVTFKAPKAGTYDFLCSFPGHYSIMKGKFIVK